ncbi:hypothetical protein GCM10010156_30660 [Planobispora rosea]|uniref:Uncharacterized protein n=1 Tax=Planobispora rosea TaxID=35762 RepID=A0A8J3RXT2_PLARO|nr:hypothetical protein [Planobispora rosea]GGS69750.1 hypothetical protein GCM10010156_30660 [Planobispora rosea]GIH83174.1 hypothetical protein Pro02_15820 [Planobispora rosea]
MSYEEKGVWVYLVVSLGAYGVYLAVILGRADGVPLSEVAYVPPMLWSIGIAVAATVVGRVAVEIVRPSESHRSDPRDKEINRFGEYVAGVVFAVVMVVPLGLAMAEADHFWIANAMYTAFVLAALVGSGVKLVAYRRGL